MVRIDHRLFDQDTFFGRYNFSDARRVDPADIPSRIGLSDSRLLNDIDMADLLRYFREGQCCWDEDNPPVNPWYKPNR